MKVVSQLNVLSHIRIMPLLAIIIAVIQIRFNFNYR